MDEYDEEILDETAFEDKCKRCEAIEKFLIQERNKNEFKTSYTAGKFDFINKLLAKYFNE